MATDEIIHDARRPDQCGVENPKGTRWCISPAGHEGEHSWEKGPPKPAPKLNGEVTFMVCAIHGPVSVNALTCPRPVPVNDPSEPQAANACGMKLTPRQFKMLPETPAK